MLMYYFEFPDTFMKKRVAEKKSCCHVVYFAEHFRACSALLKAGDFFIDRETDWVI